MQSLSREEAIAEHGVHYAHVGTWSDPIREVLGRADPNVPFYWGSEIGCRAAIRQRAAEEIRQRICEYDAGIRMLPGVVATAISILGLPTRHADDVRTLKEKRGVLAAIEACEWEPEIRRLPERIRIPVALSVGTLVFRLRCNLNGDGLSIDELPITSREVWGGTSHEGAWDYVIHYALSDGIEFEYNHPDFKEREIGCGVEGWRLFLDREAAEAAARDAVICAVRKTHHLFS